MGFVGEHWVELVRLCQGRHGLPDVVAAAATDAADSDRELLAIVGALAVPPDTTEWDALLEDDQRRRIADEREEQEWVQAFVEHCDQLRDADPRWLVPLVTDYFASSEREARDVPPCGRLERRFGAEVAEAALVGFERALTGWALPEPAELVRREAKGGRSPQMAVVIAGAWERVLSGVGFEDLSRPRASAVWCNVLLNGFLLRDSPRLLDALEATPRIERGLAELWSDVLDPQLASNAEPVVGLRRFSERAECARMLVEAAPRWLKDYNPAAPTLSLIVDGLIRSGATAATLDLVFERLRLADDPSIAMVWRAIAYLAPPPDEESDRQFFHDDSPVPPELLWAIRERVPACDAAPPGFWVSAPAIGRTLRAFRGMYPRVDRPPSSSGTKNSWDATEFLSRLIARLAGARTRSALDEFEALIAAPDDDYTDLLRHHAAQQRRLLAETFWVPPSMAELLSIATNAAPVSASDLQSSVLAALALVQSRLRGSSTRALDTFYGPNGNPRDENFCRDRLLELVERELPHGVSVASEVRMPDDKRADFAFQVAENSILVPVEVKGQWHPELWRAATTQLSARYAIHHWADGLGIYVVLWFGANVARQYRLRSPPRGIAPPESAIGLERALSASLPEGERGRIGIVVVDLERR